MKKLFLCSMILLLSYATFSQSKTTTKGTVKDLATGKGISNVSVTLLNANGLNDYDAGFAVFAGGFYVTLGTSFPAKLNVSYYF